MTITIHIGSMFFGMVIGHALAAIVFWLICAKGNAFYEGWDCGKQYAEDRQKEKMEREKLND